MVKYLISIILFIFCQIAYGYQLPSYYYNKQGEIDTNPRPFDVEEQSDQTYKIYLKTNNERIYIYHTQPADLLGMGFNSCDSDVLSSLTFDYVNNKFPYTTVFFSKKTQEASAEFNLTHYRCAPHAPVIAALNGGRQMSALIIQPVFKSQPKVWIVVPRHFTIEFPGFAGTNSNFLENGDLYLVVTWKPDAKYPLNALADKTETLKIDYSIFNQPVDKPTCYAIPPDHKMRPCNEDEMKIRSPALSAFLGEN